MATANLCRCNNCDTVLFDENPQLDAIEHELTGNEEEMTQVNYGTKKEPEWLWACPNCLTDEYLTDL